MENKALSVWYKTLKTALKIPGAIINREDFLRAEFATKCTETELKTLLETSPKQAGISDDVVNKITKHIVQLTVAETGSLSFAAGLPGGLFAAATIPADVIQFYLHEIQLFQKLAYLYGKQQIITPETRKDELNLLHLTLYFGVAYGAEDAEDALWEYEQTKHRPEFEKQFEQEAVTQVAIQIGKWLGVRIAKSLARSGTAKILPLAGGFISGGMSALSMSKSAKRLLKSLKNDVLSEK